MAQQIIYLRVEHLHPHPKNPRQSMSQEGLDELSASIKRNGVLQNLTVVPAPEIGEGEYTIIIGHRRHAASKIAGLTEVPCIVREMDDATQIRTMAMENMQRADLTMMEQAKVCQLMMDLGDSMEEVAAKTGFSTGTIRNRVRLLKLDEEKFNQAEARGVSLFQFLEISDLKDENARNRALEAAGTNNFASVLKSEQTRQKDLESWDQFLDMLGTFAKRVNKKPDGAVQAEYFNSPKKRFSVPENAAPVSGECTEGKVRYYFSFTDGGYYRSAYLYRDKTAQDKEKEDAAAAEKQRVLEVNDLYARMDEHLESLRNDFVHTVSKKAVQSAFPYVAEAVAFAACESDASYGSSVFSSVASGICKHAKEAFKDRDEAATKAAAYAKLNPEMTLFYIGVQALENKSSDWRNKGYMSLVNNQIQHRENPVLDKLYTMLTKMGYQMSDEEKAIQNGTHEIFGNGESSAQTTASDDASEAEMEDALPMEAAAEIEPEPEATVCKTEPGPDLSEAEPEEAATTEETVAEDLSQADSIVECLEEAAIETSTSNSVFGEITDADVEDAARFPFTANDGTERTDIRFCVMRQFSLGVGNEDNVAFLKQLFANGNQMANIESRGLCAVYNKDFVILGRPNEDVPNRKLTWTEIANKISGMVGCWCYISGNEVYAYQAWARQTPASYRPDFDSASATKRSDDDWEYSDDEAEVVDAGSTG